MQCRNIFKGGNIGVRAGGREIFGVYYLLENKTLNFHIGSCISHPNSTIQRPMAHSTKYIHLYVHTRL